MEMHKYITVSLSRKGILMKKYIFVFILSLFAAVTLFSMNNDALALAFPIIYEGAGNLKQQDVASINSLIDMKHPELPDIDPLSWPSSETEYEGEDLTYLFENLENVTYLITKSGNFSQLIYVGDVGSYAWTSPNERGLSNSATPVPEPGTILLMGTGLIVAAIHQRKKLRKK